MASCAVCTSSSLYRFLTRCKSFVSFNHARNLTIGRKSYVASLYDVTVMTGNKFAAGTDANVFVRLIGEKGSTNEMQLLTKKHDMERGSVDSYECFAEDVGDLKKVIIRHDNSGIAPAWFLDKVFVKDTRGEVFQFNCNDWLTKTDTNDSIVLLKKSKVTDFPPTPTDDDARQKGKIQIVVKTSNKRDSEVVDDIRPADEDLKDVMRSVIKGSEGDAYFEGGTEDDDRENSSQTKISDKHKELLSPAVRFLLDTYGVDLLKLNGSGPHSRVLKGDVLEFMKVHGISEKVTTNTQPKQMNINKEAKQPVDKKKEIPKEPTSTSSYVDTALPVEKTEILNRIALHKRTTPHLYTGIKCYAENFKNTVRSLEHLYSDLTDALVVVRVFSEALSQSLSRDLEVDIGNIDISVSANGKELMMMSCRDKKINELQQEATKEQSNQIGSDCMFGLCIMDSHGVQQLSSVLPPGQLVNVCCNYLPLTVDACGKPREQLLLSLTSDGNVMTQKENTNILRTMKALIENPGNMM